MSQLSPTTLETHPSGTINKNGLINGNWEIINKLLDPNLSNADPLYGILWAAIQGQRALTTLTYSASVALDFSKPLQLVSLTGNITFTTTGRQPGRGITLLVKADGTDRTITWPATWNWSGPAKTLLRANTAALFHIVSTTTADTGVYAQGPPPEVAPAWDALVDGATITWPWDASKAIQQASVTLGGARTLAITGLADGMRGTLLVTQDGTGGRTLALPASTKVAGSGAGAITLTATAGAVDLVTFFRAGSTLHASTQLAFT